MLVSRLVSRHVLKEKTPSEVRALRGKAGVRAALTEILRDEQDDLQAKLNNIVDDFPARIDAIIEAKGGHIPK